MNGYRPSMISEATERGWSRPLSNLYTITMKIKVKHKSVSKLKRKAWEVFSLYIRLRDGGKCFTCNKIADVKEMQAGHYVSRSWSNLLFDEKNVHCQCYSCNICKKGNMDVYALRLQSKYGDNILKELAKQKTEHSFTPSELEQIIEHYQSAIIRIQDQ